MINRARSLVDRWLPTYPNFRPWVDEEARKSLRRSEDDWLDSFRDADRLTREQVRDLIDWKWVTTAARSVTRRAEWARMSR